MRRSILAACVVVVVSAPGASAASPSQTASAAKLRSGEFCNRSRQAYFKRHGFICKRARDGRDRLFKYP